VVGFTEVLKHIPGLIRLKRDILRAAQEEGAGAALFIDYQTFNLNLAKTFHKELPGVRLHQYVCPQVWAWKAGRIPVLGRTLDTLYCLFDFEPRLFKDYPLEALWLGNPLVETTVAEVDRSTFFSETGLDPQRPLVALLPGSRTDEVRRLLPPMVELVRRWRRDPQHQGVQWVLPLASTLKRSSLEAFIGDAPILLVEGRTYAARAHADAALVCSGTATLETALLGTPFAILYRLNALTYQAAKRFVNLPHFGLVNVVAGRLLAPELLQDEVNPDRLGQELSKLLEPGTAAAMRESFQEVRAHLGESGAAERVARHLFAKMT